MRRTASFHYLAPLSSKDGIIYSRQAYEAQRTRRTAATRPSCERAKYYWADLIAKEVFSSGGKSSPLDKSLNHGPYMMVAMELPSRRTDKYVVRIEMALMRRYFHLWLNLRHELQGTCQETKQPLWAFSDKTQAYPQQ